MEGGGGSQGGRGGEEEGVGERGDEVHCAGDGEYDLALEYDYLQLVESMYTHVINKK